MIKRQIILLVFSKLAEHDESKQQQPNKLLVQKAIHIKQVSNITNEIGEEYGAVANPVKQNALAYIKNKNERFQLLIQSNNGHQWVIAENQNKWENISWSPNGKQLLAILSNKFDYSNKEQKVVLFDLDLEQQRIIKKEQIFTWLGDIKNLVWFDNTTLEFLADQGDKSTVQHYNYDLNNKSINELNLGSQSPIALAIKNKTTALASSINKQVKVSFYTADKTKISEYILDINKAEIAWVDDDTLVILSDHLAKLTVSGVYTPINYPATGSLKHLKASSKGIYLTESAKRSNIYLASVSGKLLQLSQSNSVDQYAGFSSDGSKVHYMSNRSGNSQIWLLDKGETKQLTNLPASTQFGWVTWVEGLAKLIYRANDKLYRLDVVSLETTLLEQKVDYQALHFAPKTKQLTIFKDGAVWKKRIGQKPEQQLTFRPLGMFGFYKNDFYFQYANSQGLWTIKENQSMPILLTKHLAANSKFIVRSKLGVRYITVNDQGQPEAYILNFASGTSTPDNPAINRAWHNFNGQPSDYHPDYGMLMSKDSLHESDILLLEY